MGDNQQAKSHYHYELLKPYKGQNMWPQITAMDQAIWLTKAMLLIFLSKCRQSNSLL